MKAALSPLLKALACAALLSVPAASSVAQSSGAQSAGNPTDAPLPGYWQYKYHVLILPAGDDMKCLTPKDVKKFFDGLCKKDTKCTYSTNEAKDGKVKLVGLWIDHKDRHVKVKANGVYDPNSFKLKANITLSGLPVSGTIEGKRIGAVCPPGSQIN